MEVIKVLTLSYDEYKSYYEHNIFICGMVGFYHLQLIFIKKEIIASTSLEGLSALATVEASILNVGFEGAMGAYSKGFNELLNSECGIKNSMELVVSDEDKKYLIIERVL